MVLESTNLQRRIHIIYKLGQKNMKVTVSKNKSETSSKTDAINAFMKDLQKETDRAAVIIGAAKLDLLLYQLLQKYLLPSPTDQDNLLDSDRALGIFSARIHSAYRLGLIDAEYAWALHMIRKIRNSFAHKLSSASLNAGAQRDRVIQLMQVMNRSSQFKRIISSKFAGKKATPASDFRSIITGLCIRLQAVCDNCGRLRMDHPWNLLPPEPVDEEQTQHSVAGDGLRAAPEE